MKSRSGLLCHCTRVSYMRYTNRALKSPNLAGYLTLTCWTYGEGGLGAVLTVPDPLVCVRSCSSPHRTHDSTSVNRQPHPCQGHRSYKDYVPRVQLPPSTAVHRVQETHPSRLGYHNPVAPRSAVTRVTKTAMRSHRRGDVEGRGGF
jgi:hypothetical protein